MSSHRSAAMVQKRQWLQILGAWKIPMWFLLDSAQQYNAQWWCRVFVTAPRNIKKIHATPHMDHSYFLRTQFWLSLLLHLCCTTTAPLQHCLHRITPVGSGLTFFENQAKKWPALSRILFQYWKVAKIIRMTTFWRIYWDTHIYISSNCLMFSC